MGTAHLQERLRRRWNPADKWLLSSAVQKLIRRGQADSAASAALTLHALDPGYLPRRLPIVAFEDVGIGDLDACSEVLHTFGRQRFDSSFGERQQRTALVKIVARLATATKSRAGCDIFCLAHTDQEHSVAAGRFARSSETCLVALAADRGAALSSRALALHLLSGMTVREGRWPRALSRFNEKALTVVADRLELPETITQLMVDGRHTAGLASMLPLVHEAAQSSELAEETVELSKTRAILGLPSYAADMYTRVGKSAIAEFAKGMRGKHTQLFGETSPRSFPRLIGMAIFHIEGSLLARRVENATLARYREQIEQTELQVLGWPRSQPRAQLYRLIEEEGQLLWRIRRDHMLAAYRGNGQ